MANLSTVKNVLPTSSKILCSLICFSVVQLVGCGMGERSRGGISGQTTIAGTVHGGQQPVAFSKIQLYTAGKTGNGSAATPMLTTPVSSDDSGNFNITGDYSCSSSSDQVYITATGGNPGLTPATARNPALAMMTALGDCGNLGSSTSIEINEVTTAAAAWTLAQFMTAFDHLGATSTNSIGLQNAFLNAQVLADSSLGTVPAPLAGRYVETGKLYAMANALSGCVNSDGTIGCNSLFYAATEADGIAPIDTLTAALNIVKNPGNKVSAVFKAIPSHSPFPQIVFAPNDWTMSMSITSGGLAQPTSFGIDSLGNVWVANEYGSLSSFNPQGVTYSLTGYGAGVFSESYGLAIDNQSNIWLTSEQDPRHGSTRGSVIKFLGASSGSSMGSFANPSSPLYSDASLDFPEALAADSNGQILIMNYAAGDVTIYNTSGTVVSSGLGPQNVLSSSIAADNQHGFWIGDLSGDDVSHVDALGNLLTVANCCNGVDAIAVDGQGNAWVGNYEGSSVTELAPNGQVLLNNLTGGGISQAPISHPYGIAIDAAQTVWVSVYTAAGGAIAQLAGNQGPVSAGTSLSPSVGLGLDALVPNPYNLSNGSVSAIATPYAIHPDASGNLWVSGYENNALVAFLGLAAPTATPLLPPVSAP